MARTDIDLALPTIDPDPSVVCPPCGKCCRYISVEIDPPTSVASVSTIVWILFHGTLSVYESHEGDWFLLVPGSCENLRPDGLCGVYETRPFICRDYETIGCEGTSDEPAERTTFENARAFLRWLKAKRAPLHARCKAAGIVPAALS